MSGYFAGFCIALVMVAFLFHPLLTIQFILCCFLLVLSYNLLGGYYFFLAIVGFASVWCVKHCNPYYRAISKQSAARKKEHQALMFRLYHPEEYFELEQQSQPKMSAETRARVRRIQKEQDKRRKDRVANTLPIAKDYLSKKKKR